MGSEEGVFVRVSVLTVARCACGTLGRKGVWPCGGSALAASTAPAPCVHVGHSASGERGGRVRQGFRFDRWGSVARSACGTLESEARVVGMWRRGSRCLSAVLQLRARPGGAAVVGARRLRWPEGRVPLPFPAWAAPVGSRRVSGVGSSELRGVAVENDVGATLEHEDLLRQEPNRGPSDHASSVFSIDYIVSLLRQENAKDICVIQLPPELKYTNYFIIVSGSSSRHLHAMAHYLIKMYKHLKANSDPHVVIEGKDCDDWLCIDLGNTVVHFMLPETREIYELERLWTLRSHDDQLALMAPESLPDDFVFGLTSEEPRLASV